MKPFLNRLGPWILICAGSVAIGTGIKSLTLAEASKKWSRAEGVIEQSILETNEFNPSIPRQADAKSVTFHPQIRYHFAVAGRTYTGSRVSFEEKSPGYKFPADEILARYPANAGVTVFYNPADPGDCLLEPGVPLQTWNVPILGLLLLAAGINWLRYRRKMIRLQNDLL